MTRLENNFYSIYEIKKIMSLIYGYSEVSEDTNNSSLQIEKNKSDIQKLPTLSNLKKP